MEKYTIKIKKPSLINLGEVDISKIDDAFSDISNLFTILDNQINNEYAEIENSISKVFMKSTVVSEFIESRKDMGKKFELKFSKEAFERLSKGELKFGKLDKDGAFHAELREVLTTAARKKGAIAHKVKIKEVSGQTGLSILSQLPMLLIMQQLATISTQLKDIEEKLNDIKLDLKIDRISKIQSGFETYLEAMGCEKKNKEDLLRKAKMQLSEGRAALILDIKKKMTDIRRYTSWKIFWNAYRGKNTHNEDICYLLDNLLWVQRSSIIIYMIYKELEEENALKVSLGSFKNILNYLIKGDNAIFLTSLNPNDEIDLIKELSIVKNVVENSISSSSNKNVLTSPIILELDIIS
jgi:hypothetical protein